MEAKVVRQQKGPLEGGLSVALMGLLGRWRPRELMVD
jgi:hypothetical protein